MGPSDTKGGCTPVLRDDETRLHAHTCRTERGGTMTQQPPPPLVLVVTNPDDDVGL